MFRYLVFGLASCFFCGLPQAQQPQGAITQDNGSGYNLKVTTNLISLDVVVTDRKGNPVDGLKKEDFQIFDGKTPQPIRSFEAPETHFFPAGLTINSTAELDRKAPSAPVTIIVLDEANTKFEDEAFARYSIKKYLATQPEHLSQPTALTAINLQHFMMLQDYTTSKSAILSALDHHFAVFPWQLDAGWEAERFEQSFMALSQVAKSMAGHPGHKNMIWIGHGLPTVSLADTDEASADAIQQAIDSTTNLLRDSRVTLYTIDPAGVTTEVADDMDDDPINADPFGSSVDFNAMAKETGGLALFGRNDVDRLIGESARDGNHFYTLTYRPAADAGADKYRSIRIVVNQPGLTATTRAGYYPQPTQPVVKTADEQKQDAGTDLMAASDNQMVYDGLAIEVTRDEKVPNKYLIHIPAVGLDWQHDTDPPTTNISILVATFDRKGKLIKRDAKVVKVHGRPNTDGGTIDPAINLATVVDPTNATRIRFVVRSGTSGKIGAQNVPCKNGACTPAS